MTVSEDDLLSSIRTRIADPRMRIGMDTIQPPRIYEVATASALSTAELDLGFPIQALLYRLYSEVANGGFGPGAGLIGLEGGYADADGRTLTALYKDFRTYGLREGLLPLFDLGGGAWACTDARTSNACMVTLDGSGQTPTRFTLHSWLESWITGVDLWAEVFEIEEGNMISPFTKEPVRIKRRGRAKGS